VYVFYIVSVLLLTANINNASVTWSDWVVYKQN